MRTSISRMAKVGAVLLLTGCAGLTAVFSAPKYHALADPQAVPPGQILVIGKFVLDPPVEQGTLAYYDPWDMKGKIVFATTNDLSRQVDLDAMVYIAPDEVVITNRNATSFIPMPPGSRFLRFGQFTISATCSVMAMGATPGQGGCRAMETHEILLLEDIRITVPAGATAVYVGTIVFEHDGERGTRTYVRDEFRSMLAELDGFGIPGIDSRNVSKQLAEIVTPQVVSR